MNLTGALCFMALGLPAAGAQAEFLVYYGTYTNQQSKGIYVSRFDARSGKLGAPVLAAEVASPSYVTIHPNGRILYAVSEIGNFRGTRSGAVTAFSIDAATGKLTKLDERDSGGSGPCYATVDRTGQAVLVANYGGGTVAAFALKPDGTFGTGAAVVQHTGKGANPRRQERPHAHSINMSPDNRFAIAADLGIDKLLVYRFEPKEPSLQPNDPPYFETKPGAGPRHFAFHPGGRFAYVINELNSTITALAWNGAQGTLEEIQTVTTLPEGFSGENFPAEVVVHPSGRFVYGSNRGHDSIAVFAVDAGKGTLTAVGQTPVQGSVPRNFAIDPTGAWLLAANQKTNNVVVFRIDRKTGRLTPAGTSVEVGSPVCIKFVPVR